MSLNSSQQGYISETLVSKEIIQPRSTFRVCTLKLHTLSELVGIGEMMKGTVDD